MLDQLASLAARPFGSRDEAVAAVLDLIHRIGGLRTPFLARTNRGEFEVVAVDSRGGCPLEVGTTLPLQDAY
jgi:hypothetical protein